MSWHDGGLPEGALTDLELRRRREECIAEGGHFWPRDRRTDRSVACERCGYDPGWVSSAAAARDAEGERLTPERFAEEQGRRVRAAEEDPFGRLRTLVGRGHAALSKVVWREPLRPEPGGEAMHALAALQEAQSLIDRLDGEPPRPQFNGLRAALIPLDLGGGRWVDVDELFDKVYVLGAREGDTVVLSLAEPLSAAEMEDLMPALREAFTARGLHAVVMSGGIEVLRVDRRAERELPELARAAYDVRFVYANGAALTRKVWAETPGKALDRAIEDRVQWGPGSEPRYEVSRA